MSKTEWWLQECNQPPEQDGDKLLFSEPGRVLGRVDYRSHWFKLVKPEYEPLELLVRHGAGDERFTLGHCDGEAIADACADLDSDKRYRLLHGVFGILSAWRHIGQDETAKEYRQAFAEGRLKKRKRRGRNVVKVWIEPKSAVEV